MREPDNQQLPLFELDSSDSSHLSPAAIDSVNAFPRQLESPYSKYIIYVDESGDHSLHTIDEQYPLFVLAFCVFHKRHYSEKVVSALEKFKFNYFGHDQIILHENEIRKEKGAFNIFRSREQKLQHNIALGFCLETLYEFLQEKQQHEMKTFVVVECRGKKEDNELELEFRRICDGNNRLAQQLPFEVLFSDKKAMSSGLQLADLVARPIGLNLLRPAQNNRAFEVLRRKFYCDGGRERVGSGYDGVGLKIYPAL